MIISASSFRPRDCRSREGAVGAHRACVSVSCLMIQVSRIGPILVCIPSELDLVFID
ncbi:hypothetical protein Sjap_020157 [Stephania japonica]|uniref:Uncharacterized protein n=1 Tax=Stephania japonica TaxID=461633 RepID=A0AAP0F5F6_9MAGN